MSSNYSSKHEQKGFDTLKNAFEKWENSEKPEQKEENIMKAEIKSSGNAMFWGKLAVVAAGGYVLWRNRFKVQRLLEANGISTPWMNDTVGSAVKSGVAKVSGAIEHEMGVSKAV